MTLLSHQALAAALTVAVEAARAAGALLRADLHRPGGPRGAGSHAEADAEAEVIVRDALRAHNPTWGFRAEETAPGAPDRTRPFWLVDPNDGTSAYTAGMRGSAVSIALIDGDTPVLGVVYAFAAPDDRGDLFAWAAGSPLTRNGVVVSRAPLPEALTASSVVLLNHTREAYPAASLAYTKPARYRSVPSIAYRLALVAAGDADAAVSTSGPTDWDFAAGHALLRAAGGDLLDGDGRPVRYDRAPYGNVYGGSVAVATTLAARGAPRRGAESDSIVDGLPLAVPVRGATVDDAGLLARAQGCLLGQLAGDALGALVEFQRADAIARTHPHGVRDLVDGGCWNTLAGQPTDDSEMALTLARCLVRDGRHDAARIGDAYRAWVRSRPFDIGNTTRSGLDGRPLHESRSNGSLMRVSPLAVWAHACTDDTIAALARAESAISHPNAACRDACAAFAIGIAHGLRSEGPRASYEAARAWAHRAGADPTVRAALDAAEHTAPDDMFTDMGLVTKALQNAFYQLLKASDLESALVATVGSARSPRILKRLGAGALSCVLT